MQSTEIDLENIIGTLMKRYGKLDFLQHALEKGKVTRQIINRAKFKTNAECTFYSIVSLTVILFGITGFSKSLYNEILFLIPFGVILFWVAQAHARRRRKALAALSEHCSHQL